MIPQKVLTVTANCCQGLLVEEFSLVSDALPVLSSRLNHNDKKTMDTACLALSRLADSYKHDTKPLTLLAREEVLTNLQQPYRAHSGRRRRHRPTRP